MSTLNTRALEKTKPSYSTNRAIDTVIKLSGDKPVDHYTKQDTCSAQSSQGGLAVTTSRRMFSVVRAVMNLGPRMVGIDQLFKFFRRKRNWYSAFADTSVEIMNIQQACRSINDERRWLIALLSDSGMRLSSNSFSEDFKLDSDVPH